MNIKSSNFLKLGKNYLKFNADDYYIFLDVEHNTRGSGESVKPEQISGFVTHNKKIIKIFDLVTDAFTQTSKFERLSYTVEVDTYDGLHRELRKVLNNLNVYRNDNVFFVGQGINSDIKLIKDISSISTLNLSGRKYFLPLEKYWKGTLHDNVLLNGLMEKTNNMLKVLNAGDIKVHHALYDSVLSFVSLEHIMNVNIVENGIDIKIRKDIYPVLDQDISLEDKCKEEITPTERYVVDWNKIASKHLDRIDLEGNNELYKQQVKRSNFLLKKSLRYGIENSSYFLCVNNKSNISVMQSQIIRYINNDIELNTLLDINSLINYETDVKKMNIKYRWLSNSKNVLTHHRNIFDIISWTQQTRIIEERHSTEFVKLKGFVFLSSLLSGNAVSECPKKHGNDVYLKEILEIYYKNSVKYDDSKIVHDTLSKYIKNIDIDDMILTEDALGYCKEITSLIKKLYLEEISVKNFKDILRNNYLVRMDTENYNIMLSKIGESYCNKPLGILGKNNLNSMVYMTNIITGKQKVNLNFNSYLKDLKTIRYYSNKHYVIDILER